MTDKKVMLNMSTTMHRKVLAVSLATALVAAAAYLLIDQTVNAYFYSLRGGFLYRAGRILTDAGEAVYPLLVIVAVWVYFRKRNPLTALKAAYVFWVVVVSGIVVNILKVIFGRYRPRYLVNDGLYGFEWFEFGYRFASFPSGHSATAFGIGVALAYLFPRYGVLHCTFWGLVAFTRVIVGAHFVSDVVAGSFFGALTALYLYHGFYAKKVEHALPQPTDG